MVLYGPAHEILVLMTYAQKPIINTHADVSSRAMCLNFGQVLIYIQT